MKLSAFQVHRSWLMRMVLVLAITCLVDGTAVWFAARPMLWAALIPATLPLSIFFFVALPVMRAENTVPRH
jgi:hypothetical protein